MYVCIYQLRIPISDHEYPSLYQVTCIIQEFQILDFQKHTGYRIVNLFVAIFKFYENSLMH